MIVRVLGIGENRYTRYERGEIDPDPFTRKPTDPSIP
jgi:hypothetical protein